LSECNFCYLSKDDNGDALELYEIMEGQHVCKDCCRYHGISMDYLGREIPGDG
jgi:hypothetical protein